MTHYAIRFEFPSPDDTVVFAGLCENSMGFAPTLGTALITEDANEALGYLLNGYGREIAKWGKVITVTDGGALA